MQFIPTDDYREVSMYAGLNAIEIGNADKLYSDGLDANEYIYVDPVKGFCYEKRTVVLATECKATLITCPVILCGNKQSLGVLHNIMKMDVASVAHMTGRWIYCILSNGAFIISFM